MSRDQDLRDTTLIYTRFSGDDLSGSDFSRADLRNTRWDESTLVDVNFERANLAGADFSQADLTRANFKQANLTGCRFDDAILTGTMLEENKRIPAEGHISLKSVFASRIDVVIDRNGNETPVGDEYFYAFVPADRLYVGARSSAPVFSVDPDSPQHPGVLFYTWEKARRLAKSGSVARVRILTDDALAVGGTYRCRSYEVVSIITPEGEQADGK